MKRGTLRTIAVICLCGGGGALAIWLGGETELEKKRREWKNTAVAEIALDWPEAARREKQIAEIRAATPNRELFGAWFTNDLVLMKNGDWLVLRNYCRKQVRWGGPAIDDIFVGRGSDGKWYYSNFHFCVRLATLGMEAQPADLAEFVRLYFLKEFDGKSDEALKKTWDGQWGG